MVPNTIRQICMDSITAPLFPVFLQSSVFFLPLICFSSPVKLFHVYFVLSSCKNSASQIGPLIYEWVVVQLTYFWVVIITELMWFELRIWSLIYSFSLLSSTSMQSKQEIQWGPIQAAHFENYASPVKIIHVHVWLKRYIQ